MLMSWKGTLWCYIQELFRWIFLMALFTIEIVCFNFFGDQQPSVRLLLLYWWWFNLGIGCLTLFCVSVCYFQATFDSQHDKKSDWWSLPHAPVFLTSSFLKQVHASLPVAGLYHTGFRSDPILYALRLITLCSVCRASCCLFFFFSDFFFLCKKKLSFSLLNVTFFVFC